MVHQDTACIQKYWRVRYMEVVAVVAVVVMAQPDSGSVAAAAGGE